MERAEIEALEAAHARAPHERVAQRALAAAVTTLLHGAEAARVAAEVSRVIFDKSIDAASIGDDVYATLTAEIPSVKYPDAPELGVLDVLAGAFALSRSAGRKLVQQGGVVVNGEKLSPESLTVPRERAVRGRWFLIRKGGRDIALADVG